jgi:hypothetical protein
MLWVALIAVAALLLTVLLYKPHVNYVNTYEPPPPAPPVEDPNAPAPMNFNDVFGAKNHLADSSDQRPQA